LNWGIKDLQSNALPLGDTAFFVIQIIIIIGIKKKAIDIHQ